VDVESDGHGGAIVSWLENAADQNAEVRIRHVTADGNSSSSKVVARTTGARASGFPRMVARGDHLFLAWTEGNQQSTRVRVARIALPPQ
jgi:hypothetical protein